MNPKAARSAARHQDLRRTSPVSPRSRPRKSLVVRGTCLWRRCGRASSPTVHPARQQETAPVWRPLDGQLEATIGFEPMNSGFADRRVRPLRHVAGSGVVSPVDVGLAAPRGFEPRLTDPKSAVLPLDEGAAVPEVDLGAGEEWSGRRDSNPRPSPWQGDALPTEPLPLEDVPAGVGAESQIRTGDTAIFSRVLYQLAISARTRVPKRPRRRGAEYHAPRSSDKARGLR